jgi:hypothetical protein
VRKPRRQGFLAQIVRFVILCLAIVYLVAAITSPWAFHIGGRWTPLLYWSGTGKLVTSSGTHTLFLYLIPAPHSSRLRLDGLRPTGGVQGSGWLCTAGGDAQYLRLTGTIYNGWRSTDGSLLSFRLLEQKIVDVGQKQGYFNLYGRWQGQQLVMDNRGEPGSKFRSGLKVEHASVTLDWTGSWYFGNVCASATASPARQ